MAVQIAKYHFNVSEYYRMFEAGILSWNDRFELIDGEIIRMTPIGTHHAACVDRLNSLLNRYTGLDAIVSVQSSIRLSDFSEPQPDIALLRPREDFYAGEHPGSADVLLVIEVADSSLGYDRDVKTPLYAAAAIPELWIVDLTGQVIEVHSQPASGEYTVTRAVGRGESFTAHSIPGLTLSVDAVLG